MEFVTLQNTKNRPFLATIYHDIACRRAKYCTCRAVFVTGPNGKRVSNKIPSSFQIDAKTIKEGIPDSVLHLPQVKSALKSGWLKKIVAPVQPKVIAETPAATAPKRNRR